MNRPRAGRAGVDPALVVVLAGVCAALHVGKLPPALPLLQRETGLSLVQSGFLLSLVQLAGMSLGLFVGLAADGLGLRRGMLAGLTLLGASSLAGAAATHPGPLLAWRALEGLGFLLVVLPAPSLIRALVSARRMHIMLGMWGTYMPLGAALALLCGPAVLGAAGWQGWWLTLGVLTLLMAVWLRAAVPPDRMRAAVVAAGWSRRLGQTLRAPGPWLVALCFAAYSSQWLAVVGFLPTIYAQAGVAAGASAVLTALVAGVNMLGNIASGWLLARAVAARWLLQTGFVAMALGAFVAFGLPAAGPAGRFAAVLLFSMAGGMIPGTLFSLAVRMAPGEDTVSTTVGWMQQWSALGQLAGPPLVAWVASATGGWASTWWVTVGCALAGMGLAWRIGRRSG